MTDVMDRARQAAMDAARRADSLDIDTPIDYAEIGADAAVCVVLEHLMKDYGYWLSSEGYEYVEQILEEMRP
jgi:hypothetical protein